MAQTFEFGLDTFGDITKGFDGTLLSHAQVVRNVIEEAALADALGVDAFGVGEHHRPDFAVSAPEVVLAAIASRTKRIKLGSAVTVLSSDDPIRVFERFSTLNAASNGRAEVTVGRGSFTESFPLFGLDLAEYEELFEEKLDLFVTVLRNEQVTWQGRLRPPLKNQRVFPPIENGPLRTDVLKTDVLKTDVLKTWVGVGGSPESVVRAANYDLPLALAIIGGDPKRFRPFVDLYHRSFAQLGRPTKDIAVHSPGHVGTTDAQAREEYWSGYKAMHDKIGGERGWPPIGRAQFEHEVEQGSLYVGAPETVARKIASTAKALGIVRFDMKYSAGTLPHAAMMQSIELYGKKVMPLVREMLVEAKVPAA
ncbi:MAG TPA: LLM class flavin-dependent oxidoreductase [Xanthobacteraceae bacterium]|nr:LLM class flavin-dependent oxidoreductase [Xanthobacteraceae bacterium]